MYQALYRTQRPEVFDEVVGQEHIVKILKNQIKHGSVSHAYLFCGTRGTGKTTTARLLAKAVNCTSEDEDKPCGHCSNCTAIKNGNFIDVIEIDAASNNGVENIRELRESVKYPPAVGKKKVYIIDEAHMLTNAASNALLKTLEEPPENVIFILATTEPQKLTKTILSRCLRLDFRRVSQNNIADYFKSICDARGVEIEEDALKILASNSDGSVRDGLSILEQCLAGGDVFLSRDNVIEILGTESEEFFMSLTDFANRQQVGDGFRIINEALRFGRDAKQLMQDWMAYYRSLMIAKFVNSTENLINVSRESAEKIRLQANGMTLSSINNGIMILSKIINEGRYSPNQRILLELAFVNIAASTDTTNALGLELTSDGGSKLARLDISSSSNRDDSLNISYRTNNEKVNMRRIDDERLSNAIKKDEVKEQLDTEHDKKSSDSVGRQENTIDNRPDLDLMYRNVLSVVKQKTPSATMLEGRSYIRQIKGNNAYLAVESDTVLSMVELSKKELEEAIGTSLKRNIKIIIEVEADQSENTEEELDIKKSLEAKFNIPIEIK